MIDLSVFENRDLQLVMAVLSIFEGEGVTDLRFVRERVADNLRLVALERSRSDRENISRKKRIEQRDSLRKRFGSSLPCPSCGNSLLVTVANDDGLKILGCKKCRFSRVIWK